jgi:hypothetical protein
MHPLIAQAIAAEQTRNLHAEAAAQRLAREAGRSRRPWLAVRLRRAGRAPQPAAAPRPARDPAAA